VIEFFQNNYFIPVYGIVLIFAMARYRLYYDSLLKYFPIILAYTLLTEVLGILIREYDNFQIIYSEKYHFANYLIYNIYDLVFFLYFYLIFRKRIENSNYKNIIKYCISIYIGASLINPFFENVLIFPQIYASTIGSIILIICIIMYFHDSSETNRKKGRLLKWISIGLLLFNLFYPIIMIAGKYNYELYQKYNFQQIHYCLIVIMYTCFIIGFLRMRRLKPIGESK